MRKQSGRTEMRREKKNRPVSLICVTRIEPNSVVAELEAS